MGITQCSNARMKRQCAASTGVTGRSRSSPSLPFASSACASMQPDKTTRPLSRSPASSLLAAAAAEAGVAAIAAADRTPWWSGERVIPLKAAPQHLPERADGSRWSASAIYRWSSPTGKHGVRLRRFRTAPRGWMTTVEELTRYAAAMTAIAGGDV